MCGLKLSMGSVWLASLVTPCVGVWIETLLSCQKGIPDYVTPCVGVWIETGNDRQLCGRIVFNPAWDGGLKLKSENSCI